MRSLPARKLLDKYCLHHEEWRCGQAVIYFTKKDSEPRFDRRIKISFSQSPAAVDVKKISRLLCFLDHLGHGKEWGSWKRRAKGKPLKD